MYAVRLGVRGAKWCAGQLGGRARVQRGGDLSPTYLLGAALRMHAAIQQRIHQGVQLELHDLQASHMIVSRGCGIAELQFTKSKAKGKAVKNDGWGFVC